MRVLATSCEDGFKNKEAREQKEALWQTKAIFDNQQRPAGCTGGGLNESMMGKFGGVAGRFTHLLNSCFLVHLSALSESRELQDWLVCVVHIIGVYGDA